MKRTILISGLTGFILASTLVAQSHRPMVTWSDDGNGFPVITYHRDFPSVEVDPEIQPDLVEDPYFIVGNHRLTLFTYVSGSTRLITSERSIGCMNHGDMKDRGESGALVVLNGREIPLTGIGSLAADRERCIVSSGVGYTLYSYRLEDELVLERKIMAPPSLTNGSGQPAYLVEVRLFNRTGKKQRIKYRESIRAKYEMLFQARLGKKVDYPPGEPVAGDQSVRVDFDARPREPFLWQNNREPSKLEGFPPSLFMKAVTPEGQVSAVRGPEGNIVLEGISQIELQPGGEKVCSWIIGYTFNPDDRAVERICGELTGSWRDLEPSVRFAGMWKQVLPDFQGAEKSLRRELVWDAYVLEAMADYSFYFGETQIPQGGVYNFNWGQHACYRDPAQHLLPWIWYRPEMARSAIRYLLMKMSPDGTLPAFELGYGHLVDKHYHQSDNQLWLMHAVNEYLRVTGDYGFLDEVVPFYPMGSGGSGTVLEHLVKAYVFQRDEIRLGPNGLVRMLNSDWFDNWYWSTAEAPFNVSFQGSESLMNTPMLVKVYGDLAENLSRYREYNPDAVVEQWIQGINQYRHRVYLNLLKDWGDAPWIRRIYLNNRSVGHDEVFIWPHAFTLQIPELPEEKKRLCIRAVEEHLMLEGEPIARLRESEGSLWFSPYGNFVPGVASVDLDKAWEFFHRSTFRSISAAYPDRWIGQWTAADQISATLAPSPGGENGLVFIAHPHAYQLYMYFRLKEHESQHSNAQR